ncbi:MAG: hypothetical protein U1F59_12155, partial [Candidatus Competibacteraceae bacterium]
CGKVSAIASSVETARRPLLNHFMINSRLSAFNSPFLKWGLGISGGRRAGRIQIDDPDELPDRNRRVIAHKKTRLMAGFSKRSQAR